MPSDYFNYESNNTHAHPPTPIQTHPMYQQLQWYIDYDGTRLIMLILAAVFPVKNLNKNTQLTIDGCFDIG